MKFIRRYLFNSQVIASLFILLFVYTASSKLMDFKPFLNTIAGFPFLRQHSLAVAWAIPVSELIISAWLFFPVTRILGFYGSLLLMTGFTFYIAYALVFANDLPCTCGGVLHKMTWGQHLVFNIFFTGLALAGILLTRKNQLLISRRSRIPV